MAEFLFEGTGATDKDNLITEAYLDNKTDDLEAYCRKTWEIPRTEELFRVQPYWNFIILGIGLALALITVVVFVEEIVFALKHFELYGRRVKTIWVLAVYPVFAIAALLGIIVPRAGTIVDLCSNVYFSTCLYQFVRLMVDYIGGTENMLERLGGKEVSLRGPPCCCCCICCPTIPFSRGFFQKIQYLVLQVTIIRPILHFIAAVLWANGNYVPGLLTLDNGYTYIVTMNLTSTFTAVYGLLLLQKTIRDELKSYHLAGKFLSLQLVLILTVIPNIVINLLVVNGVIPCSSLLPSKARGERIYHALVIMVMVPLSLMGRGFYRRKSEGRLYEANGNDSELKKLNLSTQKCMMDKQCMTSLPNLV